MTQEDEIEIKETLSTEEARLIWFLRRSNKGDLQKILEITRNNYINICERIKFSMEKHPPIIFD